MDNAGAVYVFETAQNLVEKVLYELLLERARLEEAVEICAEQLGDEVDVLEGGDEDVAE